MRGAILPELAETPDDTILKGKRIGGIDKINLCFSA